MTQQVFTPAEILLPAGGCTSVWPTIACDQFTSDPAYWAEVERLTADRYSTYHLVLPERYLTEGSEEIARRMTGICTAMEEYRQAALQPLSHAMVYLERRLSGGGIRRGLIGKVDLESYSYAPDAKTPIRATEQTVAERLPARIEIREQASLELPHLLLLYTDPDDRLFSMLEKGKADMTPLYDTPLMLGSGHVTGRQLTETQMQAVDELFAKRLRESPLLFAVGDGNHSLAAAKACYEKLKQELGTKKAARHPMRYALAEVVRLEDDSLLFEPIYRVIYHCDPQAVAKAFVEECHALCRPAKEGELSFTLVSGEGAVSYACPAPEGALPIHILQPFLDRYLADHAGELEYFHGSEETRAAAKQSGAVAFLFDGMKKSELFPGILAGGVLPRKAFSMGEGRDKRFYLEARAIRP